MNLADKRLDTNCGSSEEILDKLARFWRGAVIAFVLLFGGVSVVGYAVLFYSEKDGPLAKLFWKETVGIVYSEIDECDIERTRKRRHHREIHGLRKRTTTTFKYKFIANENIVHGIDKSIRYDDEKWRNKAKRHIRLDDDGYEATVWYDPKDTSLSTLVKPELSSVLGPLILFLFLLLPFLGIFVWIATLFFKKMKRL